MSAVDDSELRIMVAGRPASAALSNVRALAGDLVTHFVDNVVPCGLLPREELSGDVTRVTMGCLELAMELLDQRQVPDDDDLAGFREAVGQWAREGIPLETILTVVHEGIKIGWRQATNMAVADDVDDMADAAELLFSMLQQVTTMASKAYIAELKVVASEHHTAAHTLVTALLSGQSTTAISRHSGIEVASSYLILALHLPPHPDETRAGVQPVVAARRKLRRVQAVLAKSCGRSALTLLSPEGGTALIPGEPSDEWIDLLVRDLSVAAEVEVTAVAVATPTDEIPAAAEQAHELLGLTQQLEREPGVYRMADLVFEYQMMRPGAGRTHLVELLRPLRNNPELVETLEVHLANELNRQRSARRLHVHPNTVDYRLRRIGQLTGLDPSRPSGLRALQAALVADRLESASGSAEARG